MIRKFLIFCLRNKILVKVINTIVCLSVIIIGVRVSGDIFWCEPLQWSIAIFCVVVNVLMDLLILNEDAIIEKKKDDSPEPKQNKKK